MNKTRSGPRAVLEALGLTPKKSFGQNFLTEPKIVEAIAKACVPDDERGRAHVVEIGAGTGVLTTSLLERAKTVVAIERDRDLLPLLTHHFADSISSKQLTLQEADAAQVDLVALLGDEKPRVLAGNLPYQITGRLIERACGLAGNFERAIFMVQREVADRLLASPNTKAYGGLTVFVRAAFDVAKVIHVSRGCFFPQPTVDSTVILLTPRAERVTESTAFRALVRGAFEQRRKTLRNAWAQVATREILDHIARVAKISLDARGETLSIDDFARAASALEAS